MASSDVEIPLSGRPLPAFLAAPENTGPNPAVIVIHEALGLNDDIRRISQRFAAEGYVALAPDFLAGLGPMPFCLARFMRNVGRPPRSRPYQQLDAARAWLARRPEVVGDRIGVAGFCVGGGFALLWAAASGSGVVRVAAPFYAAVPDDPERALARICPVVASYGGRDRIFGGMGPRLDQALTTLGIDHEVTTYPDAGHSFMNQLRGPLAWLGQRIPMQAGYHEASAEDAWTRTLAFFGRHLRPSAA